MGAERPSEERPEASGPRWIGPSACWTGIIEAANDRDWERMASYISPDAIHHEASQGLGSTRARSGGRDGIIETHRFAADKLGMHWEVLGVLEADDLLTTVTRLHFANGRQALSAAVLRLDDEGRVCELYSYAKRPTG